MSIKISSSLLTPSILARKSLPLNASHPSGEISGPLNSNTLLVSQTNYQRISKMSKEKTQHGEKLMCWWEWHTPVSRCSHGLLSRGMIVDSVRDPCRGISPCWDPFYKLLPVGLSSSLVLFHARNKWEVISLTRHLKGITYSMNMLLWPQDRKQMRFWGGDQSCFLVWSFSERIS